MRGEGKGEWKRWGWGRGGGGMRREENVDGKWCG